MRHDIMTNSINNINISCFLLDRLLDKIIFGHIELYPMDIPYTKCLVILNRLFSLLQTTLNSPKWVRHFAEQQQQQFIYCGNSLMNNHHERKLYRNSMIWNGICNVYILDHIICILNLIFLEVFFSLKKNVFSY